MWLYESPVGVMQIVKDGDRYNLLIGDDFCDIYPDPDSAADNVFTQHTGYDPWDNLRDPKGVPTCVHEWQYSNGIR